ncbi:MAG: peptidoglycan DD-metalloendopeptidase family protein [Spirochaetota bacterium]
MIVRKSLSFSQKVFFLLMLCLASFVHPLFALEFKIIEIKGKVKLKQDDTERYDLHRGEIISRDSTLRTYRDGELYFGDSDGFFYRLAPASMIRIDEEPVLVYGRLSKSSNNSFPQVHFYFLPRPRQGRTVKVVVWSEEELDISCEVVHPGGTRHFLKFYRQPDGRFRALTGIDAEFPPGRYLFDICAIREDSGFIRVIYPFYLKKESFAKSSVSLTEEVGGLLQPSEEKRLEMDVLKKILSSSSPQAFWDGIFSYPLENPVIVSEYGRKRNYYVHEKLVRIRHHRGTDFQASRGTPVFSPNSGVVVFSGMRITTGNTVVIDHGQGVFSLFFHLDSLNVEQGSRVSMGEKIGEAGSTGICTGAHLHWSILVDGVYVDPVEWVKRRF